MTMSISSAVHGGCRMIMSSNVNTCLSNIFNVRMLFTLFIGGLRDRSIIPHMFYADKNQGSGENVIK